MKIKSHSIARQNKAASEMEELFARKVAAGEGLKRDCSRVSQQGEVIVLSKESWVKVCHEAETELPWLSHGTNLLIKGFEFLPTDLGRTLRIGEAVLEIIRENDSCQHLREQAPELFEELQSGWRSGVVCKVLRSGNIKSGGIVDIIG
jgi:MOSC domain-containing protein YiiM